MFSGTISSTKLACLLALLSIVSVKFAKCKKKIFVGVSTFRFANFEPGIEVALKHINNNSAILPDHELVVNYIGEYPEFATFVKLVSTKRYEHQIDGEKMMAYIGPRQTQDVAHIHKIFTRYSMIQVNPNALGQQFANVKKYPYLFNICVLFDTYVYALAEFLLYHDWRRVTFFHITFTRAFSDDYFTAASSTESILTKLGIYVKTVESLPYENVLFQNTTIWNAKFKEQRDADVRIFVFFVNVASYRFIACELYKLGMYGPKYLHIQFHSSDFHLWQRFSKTILTNCTDEQEELVIKNFIFLNRASREADHVMTAANFTVGQIFSEMEYSYLHDVKKLHYKRHREEPLIDEAAYYYDALWCVARAIDGALKREPNYVNTYDYKYNKTRLKVITEIFEKLDFQGVSRHINFIRTEVSRQLAHNNINFYQITNYTQYDSAHTEVLGTIGDDGIKMDDFPAKWSYPLPLGRLEEIDDVRQYKLVVIVILWVLAGSGMFLSIGFLVINIMYRNVTFIKLSSPNINNLICIGGIVLYASVFLGGMDTTIVKANHIPLFCNLTNVFLAIGFTLTFGSLFSKTWRIYRIFTKKNSIRSVVIRDTHLFGVVMFLLSIDVIIFISSLFVSPVTLNDQVFEIVTNKTLDTVTRHIIHRCESQYQNYFNGVILAYKGLLMLFGLFLAYETRNIQVESINDAKYIGMAVYNLALFATLGSIVVSALRNTTSFRVSYIIFSACVIQATTVTLCLVFAPKVLNIVKNFEDPNFRNGRPVLKGEFTSSTSYNMKTTTPSNSVGV